MRFAIRRSYIIPIVVLMLTAFGVRANAENWSCAGTIDDVALGPTYATNHDYLAAANHKWCATGGDLALIFQTDGNLVLYQDNPYGPNTVVWASNTSGDGYRLSFQRDTNVVIYQDYADLAIWRTNTEDHEDAHLIVQNDGNLVIYADNSQDVLWASGTLVW